MSFLLLLLPVALLAGLFGGDGSDAAAAPSPDDDDDGGGDEGADGGGDGAGNGTADVQKGGPRANALTGDADDDLIAGFGGNDTLTGLGGNDLLVGDDGADLITGGAGDDLVLGGSGNDMLSGGDGNDDLVGGTGNDVVSGDDGDDFIIDVNGNNTLSGGAGNDFIIGWRAAPGTVRDPQLVADPESRIITPMEETFGPQTASFNRMILRNVLTTDDSASFDRIEGGAGDDTLLGDRRDVLIGGEGADLFSILAPPIPNDPATPGFGFVAEIDDFEPGVDSIEIQTEVDAPFTVAVEADPEGLWVVFNGRDVAFLTGLRDGDVIADDIEVFLLTA